MRFVLPVLGGIFVFSLFFYNNQKVINETEESGEIEFVTKGHGHNHVHHSERDLASDSDKNKREAVEFDSEVSLYSETPDIKLNVPLPKASAEHAKRITLNPTMLSKLDLGATVQLELPDLGLVNARVFKKTKNTDGSYSYIARIGSDEDHERMILTVGEQYAFATVITSQGSFSMQTKAGKGYIVSQKYETAQINKEKSDHAQKKTLNQLMKESRGGM